MTCTSSPPAARALAGSVGTTAGAPAAGAERLGRLGGADAGAAVGRVGGDADLQEEILARPCPLIVTPAARAPAGRRRRAAVGSRTVRRRRRRGTDRSAGP